MCGISGIIYKKNKKKSGFYSSVGEFKKNKILFGEINDLINSKNFIKFYNNYNFNKRNIDTFTQFCKYIHAYLLIDRIVCNRTLKILIFNYA